MALVISDKAKKFHNVDPRFVWDYGGREAYVCVFQNGNQLTIPMKKSGDGKYLEADAKLRPGVDVIKLFVFVTDEEAK